MCELLKQCQELGFGTRVVRSYLKLYVVEVEIIEGETLEEFHRLNYQEESGVEKWLKCIKGREYDGDEVMLELLSEIYKKIDRLEQKLLFKDSALIPLTQEVSVCYVGHEFLCFKEDLKEGRNYYARMDLPVFPRKLVPFYFKMRTSNIAQITKMGSLHARNYDSYVVECERIEIREKREERR